MGKRGSVWGKGSVGVGGRNSNRLWIMKIALHAYFDQSPSFSFYHYEFPVLKHYFLPLAKDSPRLSQEKSGEG